MNTDAHNCQGMVERPHGAECPDCEGREIRSQIAVQQFQYGRGDGATTLSAQVPVFRCLNCGAQWTDAMAEDIRYEAVCRHLNRIPPRRLLEIREELGLSQAEFAKLTGFGVASLSRWETGAQLQSASCDRLLRLLAADPVNVERLRRITAAEAHEKAKFRTIEITPELRSRQMSFQLRANKPRKAA